MATVQTQVRIEESTKKEATELLNEMGLTLSDAVNLFLKQILIQKKIPFEIVSSNLVGGNSDKASETLPENVSRPKIMKLNYIHPLNRQRVALLAGHIAGNPAVKEIRIFGSSIRSDCHMGSDVDIYVELEKEVPKKELIRKYFDFPYDFWTNFMVDKTLYQEIMNTSIVVYKSEAEDEKRQCMKKVI